MKTKLLFQYYTTIAGMRRFIRVRNALETGWLMVVHVHEVPRQHGSSRSIHLNGDGKRTGGKTNFDGGGGDGDFVSRAAIDFFPLLRSVAYTTMRRGRSSTTTAHHMFIQIKVRMTISWQ